MFFSLPEGEISLFSKIQKKLRRIVRTTLKHSWFPLIYVTRFITCHISPFYLYLSNKTLLLWHYYLTYNCVSVQTETGSYSYCMSLVITGNELYLLYITINHNLCTIFQDRDASTTINCTSSSVLSMLNKTTKYLNFHCRQ